MLKNAASAGESTTPGAQVQGPVVEAQTSILMVDDRPANLVALEAILKPLGQRLVKASSGEEALLLLLRNDYSVILLDVQMPELDGFQTAALIKQSVRCCHIPIIFLTASADDQESVIKGYAQGGVDFILKPFDPIVLRSKVMVFVDLFLRSLRQQQLEKELREKELETLGRRSAEAANQAKDDFLATLSHELRTPLTAILGWARMLRTGELSPARTAAAIASIERNAQAQTALVEDLLDLSRIVTGKSQLSLDAVDLPSVVRAAVGIIQPIAESKGVALQVDLDPAATLCAADAAGLQQVCGNLLGNAVKFTPRGGTVVVRARRESPERVELSVSDNGRGIAPAFQPRVFERFSQEQAGTTRGHGGLGIGLSIVQHLVELHGGSVRVESPGIGHGATFTVALPHGGPAGEAATAPRPTPLSLPLRAERPQPRPVLSGQEPAAPPSLKHLKVLVVDDEPDARELLAAVLEESGATLVTAGSAAEAMEAIEREHPDLLVSDIGMPGEDGYSLIERVRARDAAHCGRMPALALTGFTQLEDVRRALASGFSRHLAKPVDPAALVALVAQLAGRAAA